MLYQLHTICLYKYTVYIYAVYSHIYVLFMYEVCIYIYISMYVCLVFFHNLSTVDNSGQIMKKH